MLLRNRKSETSDSDEINEIVSFSEDLNKIVRGSNPEDDKILKIRDLISKGADVNFKDANRGNNTALHAAVRKGEINIVKLLLESGASVNNLNSKGETSWDIAKNSKKAIKEDIIAVLESHVNNNLSPPVLIENQNLHIHETVKDRLQQFVAYFAQIFELKLIFYNLIAESEIQKTGMFSDTFSEKIDQEIGPGGGGFLGFFLVSPQLRAKSGAHYVGEKLAGQIAFQCRKKMFNILDLIDLFQNNKADFRKLLVEVGVDIFQSFEMQFMRVTTDDGHKDAMLKLAHDAVNRAVNFMTKNSESIIHIGKAVMLGKSKIDPISVINAPKTPGFDIRYEFQSNKIEWHTGSLIAKSGLVISEDTASMKYYKKADLSSRTDKYGYRRLLMKEHWETIKEKYVEENIAESGSEQFTDYQYSLNSKDLAELDNLNVKYENITEERTRKTLKGVIKDVLDDIAFLKTLTERHFLKDYDLLKRIETNLKSPMWQNQYLQKFGEYFEKTEKDRQELSRGTIEYGNKDNRQLVEENVSDGNEAIDAAKSVVEPTMQKSQQKKPICFEENTQHISADDDGQPTFNKRKGTAGISGQLYEIELSMLFLLQGVTDESIGKFHLATNMEEAGDFDDVVFHYQYTDDVGDEKLKIIFLQAKHREKAKKEISLETLLAETDKGDFLLKKYFSSYREIKKQFSVNPDVLHPIFRNNFGNSDFIIYTNALFTYGKSEEANIEKLSLTTKFILNLRNENACYYQLKFGGNKERKIVQTLMQSSDCRKLATALAECIICSGKTIDTNKPIFGKYHNSLSTKVIEKKRPKKGELRESFLLGDGLTLDDQIFRTELLEEIRKYDTFAALTKDELLHYLYNKEVNINDKFGNVSCTYDITLLPSDIVYEDEIREFLSKLKIYVDQPNEIELSEIIKRKIQMAYKVTEPDVDTVFSDVECKIRKWWQFENGYLTKGNTFFQESARVSIWFDVKKPVELFTGRKQELNDLHCRIQSGTDKMTVISQMTSISGLGGIGKTELARQYIQDYSRYFDNNVIWVSAESEATLSESFLRLANDKLRISTKNEDGKEKEMRSIVEEVYKFFSKRKSLFVFDNAEKGEYLNAFLPLRSLRPDVPKPNILITSRNREWEKGIEVMGLCELKLEDSIEFVKKGLCICDGNQDNEIRTLVEKLQRFPLAMQQAIAYIEDQNITGEFGISDYLEEYERKTKDLLNSDVFRGIDNDYAKTSFATWQITIDKIRSNSQYGHIAIEILEIVAYFAPDKIQREIFSGIAEGNEELLKSAVRLLVKYSMVNGEQKQSVLGIHRLVQEVIRLEIRGKGNEKQTLMKALKLVKTNVRRDVDHAASAWSYASTYNELIKQYSQLPGSVVETLKEIGRYNEAYAFGTKASIGLKRTIGMDNPDTLNLLYNVAWVLDIQGEHEKAYNSYNEVYQKQVNMYGSDDPTTLVTRNNMALALKNQDKFEEALNIYNEVFEKHKRILGDDDMNTLTMQSNIASIIFNQGKYDEALEMNQDILRRRIKTLGPNHLHTLLSHCAIADTLRIKGRFEEALQIYQKVLEKRMELLGAEHSGTVGVQNSMALVLLRQGRYAESLEMFNVVKDVNKRTFGSNHERTLGAENNIAFLLRKQGKYEEAFNVYKQIYRRQEETFGADNSQTLIIRGNMALVMHNQGKHEQAYNIFEEVYKKQIEIRGENYLFALITRRNMASVLMEQRKYHEASDIYENLFEKQKMILGLDNPETLNVRHDMAVLLGKQGKLKDSLETFEEVYDTRKIILGENHPDSLTSRNGIAEMLEKLGEDEEALKLFREIYEKRINCLGEYHPDTMKTKDSLDRIKNSLQNLPT